jgi:hypothetical protein
MIWLSVIRTFFISVEPFRWKIFYFSALRIFGGITIPQVIVQKHFSDDFFYRYDVAPAAQHGVTTS